MRAAPATIQQKILLLLLALALPPLVLVGWLGLAGIARARNTAVDQGRSALRSQAETTLSQRVQDKAALYDAALAGVQQQVESIASFAAALYADEPAAPGPAPVWVSPRPSPELIAQYSRSVAYAQELIPLIQSQVGANSLVSLGYIALEDGGVISFSDAAVIDVLASYEAFDPRTRPWYTQARSAGTTVWTDAYVDANTGTLATTCATPVYDGQGRLIGVVAFDLLLSTIQDDLLTVDIGENGYALLVSATGEVIVRPDLDPANLRWDEPFRSENLLSSPDEGLRALTVRMLSREQGLMLLEGDQAAGQDDSYIAYAPIATAGWSVALVIPADSITRPAEATGQQIAESQDELRFQLLVLLLALASAISLIGYWLSLSFSGRIRAVQGGVQAVAGGDLGQRLPPAGQDEIGQLVGAFNTMADALEEKVAELEENARQLSNLNTVSNELKRLIDLPQLLSAIPDLICARFGFDRAAVYLVEGRRLKVVAASFGPGNEAQAHYFTEVANTRQISLDGPTVEADVVRTGKAVIVDDPWNHPRVEPLKQAASGGHSYVQVPIFGREQQVIGLLSADHHLSQRPINPRDASQLLMFASMVGLTIQNAQLYSDLERQVAQRTEELRAALDQARLADRRKSDFLASLSHELRTPLNAIIGFSTVLIDGIDGPLSGPQREDVQSILRNGRFLLHLINELLDLARIEAGHLGLELAPVAVGTVISEVLDTAQGLLRNQAISLRAQLPPNLPPALADADRLRQILLNLLSNAVKFTEQGSVTISAMVVDEVDERGRITPFVTISVADTGVGIPPEQQSEIFQEFVQIHGRRSRMRGTGLGLAIVRKLVEAQRGRIWVDSTPGVGSTFSFTLPLAHAPRDSQPAAGDPSVLAT